ncbi:MAG TPA: ATP-binding protein [Chryseosolibacter sp.]
MTTSADIIIAIFVATILLLILSSFGIIFTVIYKKKQQAFQNEKRILEARFQEELLQAQLEIHENAMRHLAHELHDNIGQIASLVKINLQSLGVEQPPMIKEKITETVDLTRQMITDIKHISANLNGDRIAQLGIVKCMETEVDRLNRTGQFNVIFERDGSLGSWDERTSVILFRMTQEILNNIVSHSGGRHIQIRFFETENLVTLIFRDDGTGFDVNEKIGKGSGLLNLKNRAQVINAQLSIVSTIGAGTTVTIEIQKQ